MENSQRNHPSIQRLYQIAQAAGDDAPAKVARKMNISPQVLGNWESRGISKEGSLVAQQTYGCDANWIRTGEGARGAATGEPDWADIKGVRQAAALGEGAPIDEYAETHKLKFRSDSLRRQRLRPDQLAVLYGRGDSMEPTIKDGDAILFDTSDTTLKDGNIYVIQYDGNLMAKRLIDLDGRWYITSDNATDPKWSRPKSVDSTKDFEVFGRVRWVGGWVK